MLRHIFGKKAELSSAGGPLHFRSNKAAFEMECKYTGTRVQVGTQHLALIVEPGDEAQERFYKVLIADEDGPFTAFAVILSDLGSPLSSGDMATWRAFEYSGVLAETLPGDARSGWIGILTSRVRPSYDPTNGWQRY